MDAKSFFFLAISLGFLLVVASLSWHILSYMRSQLWSIDVQLMFVGFMIALTSAVLFRLKMRFDEI